MSAPVPVNAVETTAELAGHVRTDWISDERLHQRHLPFVHRDAGVFAADGTRLARRLAELAGGGWRYAHRGDPGALLDALAGGLR